MTSPGNLTSCTDCGKPVSRRAITCPHCGCPVTIPKDSITREEPVPTVVLETGAPKPPTPVAATAWQRWGRHVAYLIFIGLCVGAGLYKAGCFKPKPLPLIRHLLLGPTSTENDGLFQQRILGAWEQEPLEVDGITMNMKTTYMTGGVMNFVGTARKGAEEVPIVGSGTWKISNGHIHETVTASNIPEGLPVGFSSVDKIVSLSDSELVVLTPEGKREASKRVR